MYNMSSEKYERRKSKIRTQEGPDREQLTKEVKMKRNTLTSLIDSLINNLASGKMNSEEFVNEVKEALLPMVLNSIMEEERNIFLNNHPGEYGNGFYSRRLYSGQTPLDINVPRTRSSEFFPSAIPRYTRYLTKEYTNLVESLLISSRSIERLKMSIKRLNLPVSPEEIDRIINTLVGEFKEFITRQLSPDWLVIAIDAKRLDVKEDKVVRKAVLLTATGINMEGKKEVISSMLFYGNENLTCWREILLDLKKRGVSRALLFITDNFPGLIKLIKGLFPLSLHQICLVHLIRNAKLYLSKEEYKRFKEEIETVERAKTFDEAYSIFQKIIGNIEKKHPYFAKELRGKAEHYVTFTLFPEELRARVKSTNMCENLHNELEKIRLNTGGYFQSEKILYAKWFIFIKGLHSKRWSKPDPRFKGAMRELHNLFFQNFESDENQEGLYVLTQNS